MRVYTIISAITIKRAIRTLEKTKIAKAKLYHEKTKTAKAKLYHENTSR